MYEGDLPIATIAPTPVLNMSQIQNYVPDCRISKISFQGGIGYRLFPMSSNDFTSGGLVRRPNLLLIFPDQMRRHALGFTHQDPVQTPNLDRFATQGTYLPDATATFPLCTAWRGMMLTGRFPDETGITSNANSSRPNVHLRREEQCLTDVLHDEGYHIGYIGKWHLTTPHEPFLPDATHSDDGLVWDEFTPKEDRHGIDYWYGYNAYDQHFHPRYWANDANRDEVHYVDEWSSKHETDKAIGYLENIDGSIRDPNKPFALIVSMNPPHPPYDKVPSKYLDKYAGKTGRDLLNRGNISFEGKGANAGVAAPEYFAAVNGVDEQFGRVMDTLKRLNLEEDTVVLMTSDHGDMMGSHDLMGKPYIYEESFNVPMIFRWPGKIPAGKSDDLLMMTTDLMPTMLGMLGLGASIPKAVSGVDYSKLLLGESDTGRPETALYYDSFRGGHRGVRTHTHTFLMGKGLAGEVPVLLFDNEHDPFQMHNLAATEIEMVEKFRTDTLDWLKRIGDPWQP